MIMLRDSVIQDIIQFLEHCEGNDPGQELGRSSSGAPARGVLPYVGYIAMCRCEGYGFKVPLG